MFVVLSYYSFKVLIVFLILINREWHTVSSTAIVKRFLFDVVRLQTTNQTNPMFPNTAVMQCSHTHTYNYMEKCVHHIHTMYTPNAIHTNTVNQTLQTCSTLRDVCIRTLLMSTIYNPLLIHPHTHMYTPHTQCTHTHAHIYTRTHARTHARSNARTRTHTQRG